MLAGWQAMRRLPHLAAGATAPLDRPHAQL